MELNNPRDLLVYEMSAMYNGERKIARMLDEVAGKLDNETLSQLLRHHEQETQQQAQTLERCFQQLGEEPQDVPCATVDAIHQGFRDFAEQQPSADVLTMFALGGAVQTEHFEIAAYRGMVDKALLMGDARLARALKSNLVQEEETAGKLERFGHELGQRVLQPA